MPAIKYLPGGLESSDSDNDDFYCYDYNDNNTSKKKNQPLPVIQSVSPLELKKEKLLKYLENNQLDEIREELNDRSCKGFDINQKLDERWNLVHHACNLGSSEILKYLIEECGADSDIWEGDMSPLMIACCSKVDTSKVLEVIKVLVSQNVNFRASNVLGIKPLMFASASGHVKVVEYFLSLNDSLDAIDNHGRNALFHAIEGKQTEVARILIEAGIDLNVVNLHGESSKDYAENDNNQDILNLFPAEVPQYIPSTNFISYNRFQDIVQSRKSNEEPPYFPDVAKMLQGMNCDKFIANFAQAEVSLEQFLTISDEQLKGIGIEYPFERKTILLGLHNFHEEEWSRKSIYKPRDFNEDLSPLDLVFILANVHRQLIVLQTQFIYMKKLGAQHNLTKAYKYVSLNFLVELGEKVDALRNIVKELNATTTFTKPLLITKKKNSSRNIVRLVFVALPVLIISASKIFKHF